MRKPSWPLSFLATLGAGALIQYFMDPGRGDRRRHVLYDKARKALRLAAREAHDAAENAKNHAVGAVAEVRGRIKNEVIDDSQLVDRVRAELGHHVERARGIEVFAENGRVVLSGVASADDAAKAVATTLSVPGVRTVENHMEQAARAD
jgi:osmotically-inducible protein OsmY